MRHKIVPAAIFTLLLTIIFLLISPHIKPLTILHWKLYDKLLNAKYRFSAPCGRSEDIIIVAIDNRTIKNMAERWPYPRSDFAQVINKLKKADAKVIAFDFVFLGKTQAGDDLLLEKALKDERRVILAAAIDETGAIELSTNTALSEDIPSGIITKLRDPDGITRRNLTYLISDNKPDKGFLSWEMEILKHARNIDLSTFENEDSFISFKNSKKEKWIVPVEPKTKSFLINFCAHTTDFKKLSFYDALKGDFDPGLIKDKIVLVGMLSSVFQDLHYTPIGWLPGVTLNANALLTLYTHNFLKNIPKHTEAAVLFIGVFLSALFASALNAKKALLFIVMEIFIFFTVSYILLLRGYIWDYSLFPLLISLSPVMAKKIIHCIKIK